jgi:phosphatidylserine/phosphatidylglycerophosphate/cardiolipin synthase-like enzyme
MFFVGLCYREMFDYLVKDRFEPLLRAGVRVYEYVAPALPGITVTGGVVRPYVHAKVMVADGRVASVGSANLDVTASHWEREVNVVVESPAFAARLEAALDALAARAVALDPASTEWQREAGRRRLARTLWPDLVYS